MSRMAKRNLPALTIVALIGCLAASTEAGVVMTQDATKPDPTGANKTESHTTTIDGSRLKTVTPEITTIMDSEKGTMVIVNSKNKTYTEMSLTTLGPLMAAGLTGEFKPTGKKHTIAGHSCDEYQHDFKAFGEVKSLTCFSKDAPGAAEASAFFRRMAEKVGPKDNKTFPPEGIVLSEESTITPMMPNVANLPPEAKKKLEEAQAKQKPISTKVVVTSIKSESIPADAWVIPKDYKNQPMPVAPQGALKPGVPATK